ncbi:hypothetical protein Hanom_Chr01g00032891 [Helianthus anomalus]
MVHKPEYVSDTVYWSYGTICGDTMYFTVCECWVCGKNDVFGFDANSEHLREISFPHE